MPIPSSGSWVARAYPGSSGQNVGTHPGQNAIPSQGVLTHTLILIYSYWDNLDMAVNLTCISLGHGRKLECPKKTYTDMRRIYKLHTDNGSGQESIFVFSSTCFLMKRSYSRTYCNSVVRIKSDNGYQSVMLLKDFCNCKFYKCVLVCVFWLRIVYIKGIKILNRRIAIFPVWEFRGCHFYTTRQPYSSLKYVL